MVDVHPAYSAMLHGSQHPVWAGYGPSGPAAPMVPDTRSLYGLEVAQHALAARATAPPAAAPLAAQREAPATAAALPPPPPRAPRRRGCQHCISCAGLQQHFHSTTVRSSRSSAAEWWPGNIQSPTLYFLLRARQLQHQDRYPARGAQLWRRQAHVHCAASSLLARRQRPALAVLVPTTCTNVAQGDTSVQYMGETEVALRAQGAPPRGRDVEMETAESWSSPPCAAPSPVPALGPADAPACGPADPKRSRSSSCAALAPAAQPLGHFIAPAAFAKASPFSEPSPAPFAGVPLGQGSPGPMMVATPPLAAPAAGAPAQLAGSWSITPGASSSASSTAPMDACPAITPAPAAAAPRGVDLGAAWRGAAPGAGVLLPSLAPSAAGDPSLEQYYRRQYCIKQDQAYVCHQVVDLDLLHAPPRPAPAAPPGDWASYLRSLAGTLKAKVAP